MEVADQEALDDHDDEGCDLTNTIDNKILPLELHPHTGDPKPPEYVTAAARLRKDVALLMRLTEPSAPPAVLVRPVKIMVGYLVGDASGAGHGTSFLLTDNESLDLSHGAWCDEATNRSSNFRELANLVRRVEQLTNQGKLERGTEQLFVFTDNFVTESVFYKGAAASPYLHSLVE